MISGGDKKEKHEGGTRKRNNEHGIQEGYDNDGSWKTRKETSGVRRPPRE